MLSFNRRTFVQLSSGAALGAASNRIFGLTDAPSISTQDGLLRFDILRGHFVRGNFLLHPLLLLNNPDLELSGDVRMELDRHGEHAHALDRFFEVDLLAIHFEAVLLEKSFYLHGGNGPEEFPAFSNRLGKGAGKALNLLGYFLDILFCFCHTVLNEPFLMI